MTYYKNKTHKSSSNKQKSLLRKHSLHVLTTILCWSVGGSFLLLYEERGGQKLFLIDYFMADCYIPCLQKLLSKVWLLQNGKTEIS